MSGTGAINVKRALRTYILGRDASIDPGWKEELAGSGRAEDGGAEAASRPANPTVTSAPLFGVPVPERLAFHRSASRWRDSIRGLGGGGA